MTPGIVFGVGLMLAMTAFLLFLSYLGFIIWKADRQYSSPRPVRQPQRERAKAEQDQEHTTTEP